MTSDSAKGPPKGGMSLYANLLGDSTDAPGTISRAPVVFKQTSEPEPQEDSAAKKQHVNPASLRFQPTKRPQQSTQRSKPKPKVAPQPTPNQPSVPVKTTMADWTSREEDDQEYYGGNNGNKRQRGGRKKRKKNPHEQVHVAEDWDAPYDPTWPTNYQEYRNSDEKIREVQEWKDLLYRHRMRRSPTMDSDSDDDRPTNRMRRSTTGDNCKNGLTVSQGQFAPPSFAPPPNINDVPPPPPASTQVLNEASGEDAFARRAALAQSQHTQPPPPPPEEPSQMPRPNIPPAQPKPLDTFQPSSATISRAPVRYNLPPAPEDIPATEAELEAAFAQEEQDQEPSEDAPRSNRPGQKGFAERLLSKYGWTKGTGLGATGSGMVKPLQVQVEKRKKRPDAEGGGFVTPAGRGKIIGSKQNDQYASKFGPMCEVIILRGMLDGIDIDSEMASSHDGGVMQEIGEECNEKYGTVERVFIARDAGIPVPVFVKFVSPLSALRAVNALEGRVFNGNTIVARFFDREKFDQGIYED
ncbi:unnamed protein product [Penicillium salamii]|nr:unnamed protein product [Penicillium salamii]CAG8162874.1 unnamed protein product [Penicillium salamii]CAG8429559.1 unnamed protein product [Penicillium salamii]